MRHCPSLHALRGAAIPLLAAATLLLGAMGDARALNDYPRNDLWVTDGRVDAVARSADTIYLGGSFNTVAPFTGSAVLFDAASGERDTRLAKISGGQFTGVNAAVSDGAGGWFLAGEFEVADNTAIQSLVRIGPDGRADPNFSFAFGPGFNSLTFLHALALSEDGVLYVGGEFSSVDGQPRPNIAAFDIQTGTLTDWNPALSINSPVYAILPAGDTVYLGVGGGLLAADPVSAAFEVLDTGLSVQAMDLSDSGTIMYLGGSGLRAYNLATRQPVPSWSPAPNGMVRALKVSGSTVYVGGDFSTVGGQARPFLAALNAGTGAASGWNPAPNGLVGALHLEGTVLRVGGSFDSIGGQARRSYAEVDILDASIGPVDLRLNTTTASVGFSGVGAIARDSSRVMLGGRFTGAGAVDRRNIAALDATTGAATSWAPDADLRVQNLLLDGDTLYAHGLFSTIGGQPRLRLAALDTTLDTGNALPFVADVSGQLYDMVKIGGQLYVGGNFTAVNGQPRSHLAAVDAVSGAVSAWNPGADRFVWALDASGDTLYLGGSFSQIGIQFRNKVAAVHATTGTVLPFDPNAGPSTTEVRDVVVNGDKVYVAGNFQTIGATTRQRVAELDALSGQATALDLNVVSSSFPDLAVRGNTLFIAGSFGLTSVLGEPVVGSAAVDLSTGQRSGWRPAGVPRLGYLSVQGDHLLLFNGAFGNSAAAPGEPRLNTAFLREYDLAADEQGVDVDVSAAYAALTARLDPAQMDGDVDNNGRQDADEFACLRSLLSQGDASVVPQVASTFQLNRTQAAVDLGPTYLAQHPGSDALFAAWLMFGNRSAIAPFVKQCDGCPGTYVENSYHTTLDADIQMAFELCQISVMETIFENGFE